MTADNLQAWTSPAVIDAVNKLELGRYSPPCIAARGGCVIKKISRSLRSRRSRGGFHFGFNRKTTPASLSAEALRYFLDRSATPPCGDARRGLPLLLTAPRFQFVHSCNENAVVKPLIFLSTSFVLLSSVTSTSPDPVSPDTERQAPHSPETVFVRSEA